MTGTAVGDTMLPAPAAPGRAGSAYVFQNDKLGAARLVYGLEHEGFNVAVSLRPARAPHR